MALLWIRIHWRSVNIIKYKSHPSIKKIKSNYTIKQKFSFKPVTVKDIENVMKNVPTNKVTGGEIPLNVLKQFTYVMLRDCVNDCLLKGWFPDSLKLANIAPVHKKMNQRIRRIIDP